MNSKQRLADLENILDSLYETLGEAQKRRAYANDIFEKNSIKQRLRREVLPEIRKYEEEYWSLLAEEPPDCVDEVAASHAIVKVVEEVKLIQSQPNQYPDEFMQKLQKILDKVNEPQTPAAGKLIATLPFIPGIMSYELELDTEISLKRVFAGIKKLLKKKEYNKINQFHPHQ
ncbi:hypothetical protein QUA00_06765 [Microcoleus sp. T2B6]|uniref:hypothetical protein n=1 Tax=Microcoleus sp. T2B6 TaxID=3055424 RepID=UPI002FD4BDD3